MKTFAYCLLLLAALSCKKTDIDTVAPEYPDWYVVKAPIDRAIEGVWGSYNKTLLISTMFTIFRSTDKGENWQQVHQQQSGMYGIVQYRDTLFTMGSVSTGQNVQTLIFAGNYSIDDGKTWEPYKKYNPVFDIPRPGSGQRYFLVNPVTASTGVSYKINQVFLNGPTATTGLLETPGVVTSDSRRIDLPQLHQLNSLYFDEQERLYIAGTDAVCTRAGSGEKFRFCNSQGGRGVVYISKKPLP